MSKLLVIDDEKPILDLMRDHFSLRGYEVLTADTAEEGLRAAFKERPDVVLLDYKLTDYLGDEVLLRIKKNLPKIKVIMISGFSGTNFESHLKEYGVDCFFPKGTSILKIQEKVEEYA